MSDSLQCKPLEIFLAEFLDGQIGLTLCGFSIHYDNTLIVMWSQGSMSRQEWEEMGLELCEILDKTFERKDWESEIKRWQINGVGRQGMLLTKISKEPKKCQRAEA